MSRPNKLLLGTNSPDVPIQRLTQNLSVQNLELTDISDGAQGIDHATPAINITITDTCDANMPEVEYDSDFTRVENSRSPSFLGYMTSQSSLAVTPTDMGENKNRRSGGKRSKTTPPPLFLVPPSASSSAIKNNSGLNLNLNSSSSSNNLSARLNEFNFLRKYHCFTNLTKVSLRFIRCQNLS